MGGEYQAETLGKIFWDAVEKNAERPAQTWFEDGTWHTRSYEDFGHAVKTVASGLLGLGVRRGDRVALWSKNSIRWAEVDFANQTIGAATVPIYDTLTGPQGAYILEDCGAEVLFIQDEGLLTRVGPDISKIKGLKKIVLLYGDSKAAKTQTYEKMLESGAAYEAKHPGAWMKHMAKVEFEDVASIVYTSGTTGNPKGVILTHTNLGSNALVARQVCDIDNQDKFLSFLPLSHVFERTGGHYTPFGSGAQVVYSRSIELLTEDMLTHSPTFMMSVPRLYEKIYAKIMASVASGSVVKRGIFAWAMAQGKAAAVYRTTGRPIPASLQRKVNLAEKLVFHKLKAAVGGNLRYFVSGGAALNRDIEEFFWAAGIQILVGYGLTETSPVVNVNRPGMVRFGSVGPSVPGCELKIDTSAWTSSRTDVVEGEICVKGPMLMRGYYNNPAATKEVMDSDGFFHTGDIGYQDADGYLFITDRKKEIIVMANGKNVAPQPLEGLLKLQPHIEQACVIGDNRNYITALIVPDFIALEKFAIENGLPSGPGDQLVATQQVVSLIEKEVEAVNAQVARYEQIKKFHILPRAWTIETGELTPKLSLKRRIILDNFKSTVEKLYEGVRGSTEK